MVLNTQSATFVNRMRELSLSNVLGGSKGNSSGRLWSLEGAVAVIVILAITFNLFLAALNANFVNISRTHVIVAEVAIFAMALTVCLVSAHRLMIPWVGIMWFLVTLFLCLSIARQSVELKYLRDVLIIPAFVMLGMTFAKGDIVKLFCVLQAVILGVMLFEGIAPAVYGQTINPWDYYSNTRWDTERTSWHETPGLYLSAVRPGGRILFESLGLHRLSSVFLEPVSLGNWYVTITIFVAAFWHSLTTRTKVFLILSNIVLLVGCDGRLAILVSLVVVVLSLLAYRLPRYSYIFYLPGVVLMAAVLLAGFDVDASDDSFVGRVAISIGVLSKMDLPAILGANQALLGRSADSGVAYFVQTQSIIGVIVLWVSICFLLPPNSRSALVVMHGICVYLALGLMISYSTFSMKSAGAIWFLYGYVVVRGYLESRTGPRGEPATILRGDSDTLRPA